VNTEMDILTARNAGNW